MPTKVIQALDKTVIPINVIDDVHILAEECTGDGEFDSINVWRLAVRTSQVFGGELHIIFEAENFDNLNERFYSFDAVKGKNHNVVQQKYEKLKKIIDEELSDRDYVLL